jgi:hypothetical protein
MCPEHGANFNSNESRLFWPFIRNLIANITVLIPAPQTRLSGLNIKIMNIQDDS